MLDMKVKTLLATIESGSHIKTVQKLSLAQSAVSHQIRLLENEFDIKIFHRSKGKLKLTPQGKILIQYACRIAAAHSNAYQVIEDSKTETSHLNVGITPTTGGAIIPQVLTTLCNRNSDIHINIPVNTIQRTYSRPKAYELDFAVVEGGAPDAALASATLDMDYLCLVVSPMHRLAKVKTASVEEIRHEKLILHSRGTGTRQLFEKHLGARDMSLGEFNMMMELDNVPMIKGLVAMNLGITIITKSACHEELAGGRLAIIPIENSSAVRQIDMVYQKDPLHPEFIQNIRGIYEQLKAK